MMQVNLVRINRATGVSEVHANPVRTGGALSSEEAASRGAFLGGVSSIRWSAPRLAAARDF